MTRNTAKKAAESGGDDTNKSGGPVKPSNDGKATTPDENVQKSSATSLQDSDARADAGTTSAQAGTWPQHDTSHLPRDKETGYVVNSGPETGVEAPAAADADRYPSTLLAPTQSGPLAPPEDAKVQTVPEGGYSLSSTDNVFAEAGHRTLPGEDYLGLVDDNDKPVDVDDLFDYGDGSKTTVTAKVGVWEQFVYPNTVEVAKRRLFTAGARVPRAQAERVKAAVKSAPPAADADRISL